MLSNYTKVNYFKCYNFKVKSLLLYFQERFPIPLVFIFALSYSMILFGICFNLKGIPTDTTLIALAGISFVGFLLRLRIVDEFKDFKHDNNKYPNRPLQRNAISKKTLTWLGISAFLIEILSIYLINPKAIYYYLPVIFYSLLTAKEFFVSSWLTKHFNIYFLSHQIIFITFTFWAYSLVSIHIGLHALYGLIAFVLSMSVFEILRKLEYRYDKKGKIINDTYPSVWGNSATNAILITMMLTIGLMLTLITENNLHLLIALISVLFTYSGNFAIIRIVLATSLVIQGITLLI